MRSPTFFSLLITLVATGVLLWSVPGHTTGEDDPNISGGNPITSSKVTIATAWKNVANDENSCLDRAKTALGKAGFTGIEVVSQSVFGDYGDYKGTVRCAPSERIVFFVVAGVNSDTAFRRVNDIVEGF
jgi:hypothetical protein